MQEIIYNGEWAWAEFLGRSLINVSFFSVLLLFLLSIFSWKKKNSFTDLLCRVFNWLQFAGMLASLILLYVLIFNHRFEFFYVWKHTAITLSNGILLSSLWAGQEGSLLLWAFFQSLILALLPLIMKRKREYYLPFIALSQLFVLAGLTGWGNWSLEPFIMLRNHDFYALDPLFKKANYVLELHDGSGLNPLLENFWMMSHPPALFLGYAFAVVPFALAGATIITKDAETFILPLRRSLLLAAFLLGAGLAFGGAWAYVALNFGGFWSWDPVENASLVPWIMMLAAIHFVLLYRKQTYGLWLALITAMLSFVLIIFSAYLTRSGILSDVSVHSFTSGNAIILVSYLLTFLLLFLVLSSIAITLPDKARELKDNVRTSWFWIFIGSVVLVLSALHIIFSTAIPVWNSLLGTSLALPMDRVEYFNRWQILYVIVFFLFLGIAQINRFKKGSGRPLLLLIIFLVLSAVLTYLLVQSLRIERLSYIIFLLSIFWAFFSSLEFLFSSRGIIRNRPAALAHIGFAVFMAGALFSFPQKYSLKTEIYNENLVLQEGERLKAGLYNITFSGIEKSVNRIYYSLLFQSEDDQHFELQPSRNINAKMSDPDTRHLWDRDIYTYLTFASNPENKTQLLREKEMQKGDTLAYMDYLLRFDSLAVAYVPPDSTCIHVLLSELNKTEKTYSCIYSSRAERKYLRADSLSKDGLMVLADEPAANGKLKIRVVREIKPLISFRIVVYPYINILWIGLFFMCIAFVWALIRVIRKHI